MSETKEIEFKWEFTSSNKYYNKHFTLNIYIFLHRHSTQNIIPKFLYVK